MIVSVISSEMPVFVQFPEARHAFKATVGKVGIFFLLCGKYKDVLDFGSNRGSCIRTLRKMSLFHLISWCGNFVEGHSFHIVSSRKLSEITALYAVEVSKVV